MWCLRHLREFCNTPDEHHAVCMGLLFPLPIWWPICRWNVGESARILGSEPWYVALGMSLRVIGLILLVKGVF
uniref:Uncharacterized protein n=1 Tax=viral metagenome TaxID=1070528 RepID=A0A6M3KWB5_9ZZZZ